MGGKRRLRGLRTRALFPRCHGRSVGLDDGGVWEERSSAGNVKSRLVYEGLAVVLLFLPIKSVGLGKDVTFRAMEGSQMSRLDCFFFPRLTMVGPGRFGVRLQPLSRAVFP